MTTPTEPDRDRPAHRPGRPGGDDDERPEHPIADPPTPAHPIADPPKGEPKPTRKP